MISNPRKSGKSKIEIRPVQVKNALIYQATTYANNQAFHKNLGGEELVIFALDAMADFKQLNLWAQGLEISVLVNKKGKATIKRQNNQAVKELSLFHNRKKKYILPDHEPLPFLVELGVQTPEGKLVDKKIKKFKQINRFLEFIRDIEGELPRDRQITIIDFGCGKSYLTFAVYHYLKNILGLDIKIIGLDLKRDVIDHCNRLAKKFSYDNLTFLHGDISDFEGVDQVDLVMTLHACDVATDFALNKAVTWGAKVILSVPCCQHELNREMDRDFLQIINKYGILKERMAALITDGLRANLLETKGYQVQILEFIDMAHTPKNLMIRAVKKGGKPSEKQLMDIKEIEDNLGVELTLQKLLSQGQKKS